MGFVKSDNIIFYIPVGKEAGFNFCYTVALNLAFDEISSSLQISYIL